MLTKEAILAADDLPREKVDVPEWGGEVYVRALTGAQMQPVEDAAAFHRRQQIFQRGLAGLADIRCRGLKRQVMAGRPFLQDRLFEFKTA